MKIILCLVLAAIASSLVVSSSVKGQSVAAVQKVIQMLTDMAATAKQELNDEQIRYAKFNTWCEMESAALKKEIAKDAEEMELLSANIGKLTSEAKTLGEEIAKLTADVATAEADIKAAKAQREKDHAEHVAESQDYGESVDALERAINVLSSQDYDRTGADAKDAFAQLSKSRLPAKAKSMVAAFMGMSDDGAEGEDGEAEMEKDFMAIAPPEANGYEFQSGGIIGMLKKLRDEFRQKKSQTDKEEMNSKHAFEMRVQDLTDLIENGDKDIQEKKELKALKESQAADDKRQLAATAACKAEDEKTLAAMQAECSEKGQSFKEKQQLRADEIEAIEKAIEILSSDDVTGNAEKHLALAQAKAGSSLAHLLRRQEPSAQLSVHQKIREFLASEGRRLHSRGLAMLAEKMAADPFAKVKKLIDNMITRLLEEANADAEHEGWCDKEIGESKITRAKLTEEIDGLNAAVEQGKANIISLTEDIKRLTQEVADIDAAVAEATEMREAEKAKNAITIEDAIQAKTAVEAATAIIKDFYAKAMYATAFVQTNTQKNMPHSSLLARGIKMGSDEWNALANPDYVTGGGTKTMDNLSTATTGVDKGHKEGMQTFGETYQGQQDEAGGVVALLETIHSDFAAVEADTKAAETENQRAYEEFMTESKKNRAVKSKKIEMNTSDRAAAEKKLQEDIADLKATQDELLAADRYHAKLVPQCIDQGMTWDERVKAREEEIASLREALGILSSADIQTSAL